MRKPLSIPVLLLAAALAGCSLSDLTDVKPPSNIADPGVVETYEGAMGLYGGTIVNFAKAFAGDVAEGGSYARVSGLLTDEYQTLRSQSGSPTAQIDLRQPQSNSAKSLYSSLHSARQSADLAIGALQEYAPSASPTYVGEMYALEGYVYILFGELYCSGVPFSRTIYGGDIEYGKPLTTAEMFQAAVARFDTALTFATDDGDIHRLALVGKARALLDLDDPAAAAALVDPGSVPTDFEYVTTYSTSSNFPNYLGATFGTDNVDIGVADRKGQNGLDYVSAADSGDPRVAMESRGTFGAVLPTKFPSGDAPIPLASGIEARLIEAEAHLRAGEIESWAAILNALRQTAISPAMAELPADSTIDASDGLRQNVMFRERAFWLFGTGHRQGDLRRLIRQYGRDVSSVYAVGSHPYVSPPFNSYGQRVNLSPPDEELLNPYYHGCIDENP